MKKLKSITSIALIVMMATVFIPILPGKIVHADANDNQGTFGVEEAVCEINGTSYSTMDLAIYKSKDGDTIKLLSDVNECIKLNNTLTIDLNGFTINGSSNGSVITVYGDGNLTLVDTKTTEIPIKTYQVDANGLWESVKYDSAATPLESITSRPDSGDKINVTGGTITGGKATSGGGILVKGALSAKNINVIGNIVCEGDDINGGGIHFNNANAENFVENCNIIGNVSMNDKEMPEGGGINIETAKTVSIKDSRICYNSAIADGNATIVGGGGIMNKASLKLVGKTEVSGNLVIQKTKRTGSENRHAFGGGIYNSKNGTVEMGDADTKITGNIAKATVVAQGGGLYNAGKIIMTAGTISNNEVDVTVEEYASDAQGGGVAQINGDSILEVGGTAIILNNKTRSGANSNVWLRNNNNAYITVSKACPPTTMRIGISTQTMPEVGKPILIIKSKSASDIDCFIMDNPDTRFIQSESTDGFVLTLAKWDDINKVFLKGTGAKKAIKYTWNKVEGATTYKLYQAKCGKKAKCIKSTAATSFKAKKLKKNKSYKAYVVAYDVNGKELCKSPSIHCVPKYSSRSNATKVTAGSQFSISIGGTINLKGKIAKKSSKKKLLCKNHCAKIRYFSGDSRIASVDSSGQIKGLRAGKTYVYSVAPSGAIAKSIVVVN